MALKRYAEKRDFSRTPEPAPAPAPVTREGPLTFTIQKHAARRLHYDFRLEIDGVLVSWPIPKGPSYDQRVRRLAIQTEDHPYEYGTFEGVIPAGEYGGGQVIVWDCGSYTVIHDDVPVDFHDRTRAEALARKGLAEGHLSVFLNGRKLKGGWTLIRTSGQSTKSQWFFVKRRDGLEDVSRDVVDDERSVLSGLTIDDLAAGRRPQRRTSTLLPTADGVSGARRAAFPKPYEPMLPTLTAEMFQRSEWLYEPKLDGYRVLAFVDANAGRVHLRSRGGQTYEDRYPEVVEALATQPFDRAVLDGEVVALGPDGQMSFQRLQNRAADPESVVRYYAFDLLYLDGYDLRSVKLADRKPLLHAVVAPLGATEEVAAFDDGMGLFRAAQTQGLEGVVAKRRDSLYEPGKRVRTWLKVKTSRTDEFVIVGYTSGTGRRQATLGSLILGTHSPDGRLRYAGHVGTGFDEKALSDLLRRLQPLRRKTTPLDEPVPRAVLSSRTRPGAAGAWVEPQLVAEIKFAERTEDGRLRHPVFVRLREDKPPRDVHPQEVVVAPPSERTTSPRAGRSASAGEPASSETSLSQRPYESNRTSSTGGPSAADGAAPSGGPSGADGAALSEGPSVAVRASRAGGPRGASPSVGTRVPRSERSERAAESPSDEIAIALQVVESAGDTAKVRLDDHDLKLTSLNKVLWPATDEHPALTKTDLFRYFLQIAPVVLPHLRDRPVTMTRFPDGIHRQRFYQKSPKAGTPTFVERFTAFSEDNGADVEYFVCNNTATLLWLAQLADLELHVTHTRITNQPDAPQLSTTFTGSVQNVDSSTLNYPDFLVTDLDPYIYSGKEPKGAEPELNPEGFSKACEVALWYREMLESIGLHPFIKTSGKTGLHLYVPIARTLDYDSVRAVAETLARGVLAAHPGDVTIEWATAARRGKVFLDYNMNRRSASLAAVYSPRAVDFCGVSTPLRWEELERAYPTQFTLLSVPDRLRQQGDMWRSILDARVDLRALLR